MSGDGTGSIPTIVPAPLPDRQQARSQRRVQLCAHLVSCALHRPEGHRKGARAPAPSGQELLCLASGVTGAEPRGVRATSFLLARLLALAVPAAVQVQSMSLALPPLCRCSVTDPFDVRYVWRCGRNCPLYARPSLYERLLNDLLVTNKVLI